MERNPIDSERRAAGRLLAGLSREALIPLETALAELRLMAHTGLNEDQYRCLSQAMAASLNLHSLLETARDMGRVDAGETAPAMRPFCPEEAIRPVLDRYEPRARAKGLAMALRLASDLPRECQGDPDFLGRILDLMAGHALAVARAGRIGLALSVLAGPDGSGRLDASVTWDDPDLHGGQEEALFEAFARPGPPGLPLARSLARSLGGSLTAATLPGRGMTLRLACPVALAQVGPRESREPAGEQTAGDRVRLLLVDDDPINRVAALGLLRRLGYAAGSADSGQTALDQLASAPYDLVLMDVQMPGMDGMEVARRIRSGTAASMAPNPVILAMTAHTTEGDRAECLAAGMDGFIPKPVDIKVLDTVIRSALAARRGS
jgi:CheY-like chemotaxis protein